MLLFIKCLRVISEEKCCICVTRNESEKIRIFHVKPGMKRSSRLHSFILEERNKEVHLPFLLEIWVLSSQETDEEATLSAC